MSFSSPSPARRPAQRVPCNSSKGISRRGQRKLYADVMAKDENAGLDAFDRGVLKKDLPGIATALDRAAMSGYFQAELIGLQSSQQLQRCSLVSAILLESAPSPGSPSCADGCHHRPRLLFRIAAEIRGSGRSSPGVATLLRAEIVRELRRYPTLEYTFTSSLLREAVLSTMTPTRLKAIYGKVGALLEEGSEVLSEENPGLPCFLLLPKRSADESPALLGACCN